MSDTPNNDEVICPNCVHQFRAIPVNVQDDLAAANAKLAAKPDVAGLVDALGHQTQIDEDGVMVGVSRQAVDEARTALLSQAAQLAEKEAECAGLLTLLQRFVDDVMPTMRALDYPLSMGLENFEVDVLELLPQ